MPIEVFMVTAAIYFVICYPMSLVARRLEKRALHA
jgi:ABC-type amino acid transport system permease subunit